MKLNGIGGDELGFTPNPDFAKIDLDAAVTETLPNGWKVWGGLEGLESTPVAPAAPMIGQTLPPPGAETGFQALMDLPNDIAEWISDVLDGFNRAAPIMSFLAVFSGGVMPWLTAAFLGLKIFQIGRTFWEPGQRVRGPVNLTYYKVPTATTQPVVAYLNNAHGIEVRGTQEDGQGNTMIGVPIYHSGKADRAFGQLQKSTDLQYTRL